MLCYNGPNTKEFKPLGQLKHISMFDRFSFLVNQSNHVEVCGSLELKDKTINSPSKTYLEVPEGKLIDVSVSLLGANVLVETQGVKKVFYVGKSHFSYHDIGVLNKEIAANWTEISLYHENCSSFASTVYYN